MINFFKKLFAPHVKHDTPLPLYAVYNEAIGDLPLTFVPTEDEAIRVINRYLLSSHYSHYRQWCRTRDLPFTFPDVWAQYIAQVIAPYDNPSDRYEVRILDYDLDFFASVLRRLSHCLPLGFDYEFPDEFIGFFNADIQFPLNTVDDAFQQILDGFLEASDDFHSDFSGFESVATKILKLNGTTEHLKKSPHGDPSPKEEGQQQEIEDEFTPPAHTKKYFFPNLSPNKDISYTEALCHVLEHYKNPDHFQDTIIKAFGDMADDMSIEQLDEVIDELKKLEEERQAAANSTPVDKNQVPEDGTQKPSVPEKAEIRPKRKYTKRKKVEEGTTEETVAPTFSVENEVKVKEELPKPKRKYTRKQKDPAPVEEVEDKREPQKVVEEKPQPKKRGRKPKAK